MIITQQKALNGLLCVDVPLRNYSLTHLSLSNESSINTQYSLAATVVNGILEVLLTKRTIKSYVLLTYCQLNSWMTK